MDSQVIIYKSGGRKYELIGSYGCWAREYDRYGRVQEGDTRVIKGVLMYAYRVYHYWFKSSEIHWCPVDDKFNTNENIRKFLSRNNI